VQTGWGAQPLGQAADDLGRDFPCPFAGGDNVQQCGADPRHRIRYSDFREAVAEGEVQDVQMSDEIITGTLKNGEQFSTVPVPNDYEITKLMEDNGVRFTGKQREQPNMLLYILLNSLPFMLILGLRSSRCARCRRAAVGGAMGFGKSKAKLLTERRAA
jgi:cell division protease FtsH